MCQQGSWVKWVKLRQEELTKCYPKITATTNPFSKQLGWNKCEEKLKLEQRKNRKCALSNRTRLGIEVIHASMSKPDHQRMHRQISNSNYLKRTRGVSKTHRTNALSYSPRAQQQWSCGSDDSKGDLILTWPEQGIKNSKISATTKKSSSKGSIECKALGEAISGLRVEVCLFVLMRPSWDERVGCEWSGDFFSCTPFNLWANWDSAWRLPCKGRSGSFNFRL